MGRLKSIFLFFFSVLFFMSILFIESYEVGINTIYEEVDGTPVVINKNDNELGELIVLAHGFAGSTSFMRSLAVSLAKDGHTTVRFDFLGHGRNSTPFFYKTTFPLSIQV